MSLPAVQLRNSKKVSEKSGAFYRKPIARHRTTASRGLTARTGRAGAHDIITLSETNIYHMRYKSCPVSQVYL